jgi:hypothetical protein
LAVDRGCLIHDDPMDCSGELQVHHVITQQQLRRAGRDDLLWDPANGISLCEKAHRQHHSGFRRVPRGVLPRRCLTFASTYEFDYLIERYYP